MLSRDGGALYRRSAQAGVSLVARRAIANVLRLVALAVLARHVTPAEFGLAAWAQVLMQFVALGGETGVATYLIQHREPNWRSGVSPAFWLSVIFGAGVALLAAAPLAYAGDIGTNLHTILFLLGVAFFIRQLSAVPEALLRRDIRYAALTVRDVATDVSSAAAAVVLAIYGYGLWSLILPAVLAEALRLLLIAPLANTHLRTITFNLPSVQMVRYCANVIAQQFLSLISNDFDTVIIGRALGTTALGFYNLAWQLANIVGRQVSSPIVNVTTVSFAVVKESPERLAAAYARLLRLLACVSMPILCVMFAAASPIILLFYGGTWLPSVVYLKLFVVFAAIRVISAPAGALCNVLGRPDLNLRYALIFAPFYILGVFVGLPFGALGICVAVTVVRSVGALLWLRVSANTLKIPCAHLHRSLARLGTGAVVLGLVAEAALDLVDFGPIGELVMCGAIVVPAYATAVWHFERSTFIEGVRAVHALLPRTAGTALLRAFAIP